MLTASHRIEAEDMRRDRAPSRRKLPFAFHRVLFRTLNKRPRDCVIDGISQVPAATSLERTPQGYREQNTRSSFWQTGVLQNVLLITRQGS